MGRSLAIPLVSPSDQRLAATMQRKGWTQAQIGQQGSLQFPDGEAFNPVNISRYVHGRSHPGPRYQKALIEALALTDAPTRTESASPRRQLVESSSRTRSAIASRGPVRLEDGRAGSVLLEIKQPVL